MAWRAILKTLHFLAMLKFPNPRSQSISNFSFQAAEKLYNADFNPDPALIVCDVLFGLLYAHEMVGLHAKSA
jgi:hypothetical protein